MECDQADLDICFVYEENREIDQNALSCQGLNQASFTKLYSSQQIYQPAMVSTPPLKKTTVNKNKPYQQLIEEVHAASRTLVNSGNRFKDVVSA